MQDATSCAEALHSRMRQAISAAPRHPQQASAEVWAALWRIAQLSERTSSSGHAAVADAIDYIEAHLAEPITVPRIAAHAGISHNHLTRLFRAETGKTVVAHLRSRRLARAEHLLRHSTLPISVVASSTGIPDLQAFNKACRQEFGASPRAIRAAARRV